MVKWKTTTIGIVCFLGMVSGYAQEKRYVAGESIIIGQPIDIKKEDKGKHVDVVRYVAGDTILLGQPIKIESKKVESRKYVAGESIILGQPIDIEKAEQGKRIEPVRYVAGDTIVLGQPIKIEDKKVETIRYVAGDSIIIGNPIENKKNRYSKASYIPLVAALGDSITTHIGVSSPGLKEANGLINTSPAGLVGLFVIKAGVTYYFEGQKPSIRKAGLKTSAGIWSGISAHNLMLIAGATNPISIIGGALFGTYMYKKESQILENERVIR